ncbi:CaiB/BaiF CoA transferase family protein [Microbacterium sp. RD1]|uniref:CaiB/BaiF CoA transferase family protein n=1 Tax=Microbacterium sp. RD1 TaxID=3457313 RepID=UPI003FA59AF5
MRGQRGPQSGKRPGALDGIRVVDVSSTFMGPYCTSLLAQWGADVVKVEPPHGDVMRLVGDSKNEGMGPVFINANRGKRSLGLDLKSPAAREVLDRLVRTADIFVHNVRASGERRLGIDAPRMLEVNPTLVHCSFRGFGSDGPYASRPAYDDVIQAASGVAVIQGNGGAPEYVRQALADKLVGVVGASAILAALRRRDATGIGQSLEVPMFETMAAFTLVEQQGGWVFDPPTGKSGYSRTESPSRRPYRTADGFISVMVYTDAQWGAFFGAIGRDDLAHEPRFRTIRDRTVHIDELYGHVDAVMSQRTTADWLRIFDDADVPSGPVNTIPDLFEDPHLEEVGFFERVDVGPVGGTRLARPSVDLGEPGPYWNQVPAFAEHSRQIMAELDFDADETDRLISDGAVIAPEHPRARPPLLSPEEGRVP